MQFCNGWLSHWCVGSSFICVKASYRCLLLLKLLFSVNLTLSLPWCHLKMMSNVWNLKPLSHFVSFFALACEKTFITAHSIERRCYRTGKYTVCRHVPASFSLDILQARAVKGLKWFWRDSFEEEGAFSFQHLCFVLSTGGPHRDFGHIKHIHIRWVWRHSMDSRDSPLLQNRERLHVQASVWLFF